MVYLPRAARVLRAEKRLLKSCLYSSYCFARRRVVHFLLHNNTRTSLAFCFAKTRRERREHEWNLLAHSHKVKK